MNKERISKYEIGKKKIDFDRALYTETGGYGAVVGLMFISIFLSIWVLVGFFTFNDFGRNISPIIKFLVNAIFLLIGLFILLSIVSGTILMIRGKKVINLLFFDDYLIMKSQKMTDIYDENDLYTMPDADRLPKKKSKIYIKCKYDDISGYILQNNVKFPDKEEDGPSFSPNPYSGLSKVLKEHPEDVYQYADSYCEVLPNGEVLIDKYTKTERIYRDFKQLGMSGLRNYIIFTTQHRGGFGTYYIVRYSGRFVIKIGSEMHECYVDKVSKVREYARRFLPQKNKAKFEFNFERLYGKHWSKYYPYYN